MAERIHLAIFGAAGRMGQALLRAAAHRADLHIGAALVRPGSGAAEKPLHELAGPGVADLDFTSALDPDVPVDALIDFSGAAGFDAALALALERRAAFVSGSTGLSLAQHEMLARAAQTIPALWASNFSLGVALLMRFARQAGRILADWDCEIVEIHHRRKLDAPSGTALSLGETVAAGRDATLVNMARHGRSGQLGLRPSGEIGFHALRGGDVVGEHMVIFAGDGERLELGHRAGDRDIFARGALLAATRLVDRAPALYAMDDVLDA